MLKFSAIQFPSHCVQKDLCFNDLKTPQCSDQILCKLVTHRFWEKHYPQRPLHRLYPVGTEEIIVIAVDVVILVTRYSTATLRGKAWHSNKAKWVHYAKKKVPNSTQVLNQYCHHQQPQDLRRHFHLQSPPCTLKQSMLAELLWANFIPAITPSQRNAGIFFHNLLVDSMLAPFSPEVSGYNAIPQS